jgi:hypothetical protein
MACLMLNDQVLYVPSLTRMPLVAGLGEIFDLRDKAVVISCMHVFCLACLSRWSTLKKFCPLCKVCIRPLIKTLERC